MGWVLYWLTYERSFAGRLANPATTHSFPACSFSDSLGHTRDGSFTGRRGHSPTAESRCDCRSAAVSFSGSDRQPPF